jgi:hypothetical protein
VDFTIVMPSGLGGNDAATAVRANNDEAHEMCKLTMIDARMW